MTDHKFCSAYKKPLGFWPRKVLCYLHQHWAAQLLTTVVTLEYWGEEVSSGGRERQFHKNQQYKILMKKILDLLVSSSFPCLSFFPSLLHLEMKLGLMTAWHGSWWLEHSQHWKSRIDKHGQNPHRIPCPLNSASLRNAIKELVFTLSLGTE